MKKSKKLMVFSFLLSVVWLSVQAESVTNNLDVQGGFIYNHGAVNPGDVGMTFTNAGVRDITVSAGQLSGVDPETGNAITNAANLLSIKAESLTTVSNIVAGGSFIGDGSGLTNLNVAAAISAGSIDVSQLSTNVVLGAEIYAALTAKADLDGSNITDIPLTLTVDCPDQPSMSGAYAYSAASGRWSYSTNEIYKDTLWYMSDGVTTYHADDNGLDVPPTTFMRILDYPLMITVSGAGLTNRVVNGHTVPTVNGAYEYGVGPSFLTGHYWGILFEPNRWIAINYSSYNTTWNVYYYNGVEGYDAYKITSLSTLPPKTGYGIGTIGSSPAPALEYTLPEATATVSFISSRESFLTNIGAIGANALEQTVSSGADKIPSSAAVMAAINAISLSEIDGLESIISNLQVYVSQASITVQVTDNEADNGQNLIDAYAAATNMNPSVSNRVAVIVSPGRYDLGTVGLQMNTPYVDLIGQTSDRAVQYLFGSPGENNGVIKQTADFVRIENLTIHNQSTYGMNWSGSDPAAYFPTTSGSNTVARNCEFSGDLSMRVGVDYAGRYEHCISGDYSFGVMASVNGTFINCQAGSYSFGSTMEGGGLSTNNAILANCTAGGGSFGSFNTAATNFNYNASGHTFAGGSIQGSFVGNGSGLTNLNVESLIGTMSAVSLPTSGVWNASGVTITNATLAGNIQVSGDTLNISTNLTVQGAVQADSVSAGGENGTLQYNDNGILAGNTNLFIHPTEHKLAFRSPSGNFFRGYTCEVISDNTLIYSVRNENGISVLRLRKDGQDTIRFSGDGSAYIKGNLQGDGQSVADGFGLTNLNGESLSGTISATSLPTSGAWNMSGMTVSNLNAKSLSGTMNAANLPISGVWNASGMTVTDLNAESLSGTMSAASLPTSGVWNASGMTVNNLVLSGNSIDAADITSGVISTDRLPSGTFVADVLQGTNGISVDVVNDMINVTVETNYLYSTLLANIPPLGDISMGSYTNNP